MVAITAYLYLEGSASWYTPLVLAALLAALAAGYWFRVRPNVTVWKFVYVMGFACWIEVAFVFGQVALGTIFPGFHAFILAIPDLPRFGMTLIPGYVVGAFVGYLVGKRRDYRPPGLV